MTAAGQSTCTSSINNSQTTVVLGSTALFPVPLSFQQFSAVILDKGNPAWSDAAPLATPFEYVFCTNNNTGTNTLTIVRGQEGTTAHNFFAGAIVAGTPLPSDFTQSFSQKIGDNTLGGLSTALGTFTIPSGVYKGLWVKGRVQGNGATVDVGLQFNADTAANYSMTQLFATSGTPQSTGPATSTSALIAQAASGSSCTFAAYIGTPNDTSLTNKTIICHFSTQGEVGIRAAYWNQLSSITSLVVVSSGNCIAGSFVEVIGDP
jgi:hypothetical protein